MNDFVTAEQLASFGAAVAAVVAIVNTALLLGGEKLRDYAKWVAIVAAIGVTIAARGLPQTLNAGLTLAVNAVYVFLAALGGNGVVVEGLNWRQARQQAAATAKDVEKVLQEIVAGATLDAAAKPARFWRKW